MTSIYGKTLSDESMTLLTDDDIGSLVQMNHTHWMIHQGRVFESFYLVPHGSLLADDANMDLRVKTGDSEAHLIAAITAGGAAEVYLYENTTFTDGGTNNGYVNLKRASTNSPDTTVYKTVTVNSVGTKLAEYFIPGGAKNFATGGGATRDVEWELKPNTEYLFRTTNRSGGTIQAAIFVQWYEE